ncbi:MAG: patatin-like phospholipase family protein [Bacteroidales bacterium]|nr:patatin-like phospholipase family protein [Bacteroidales bacterium]
MNLSKTHLFSFLRTGILALILGLPVSSGAFASTAGETASEPSDQRPAIGLTLSGGGARGLAHVGVLHILDSLGVSIDYITGTSMGSIVGGMYAAGYSAAEIETFAVEMNWEALFARRPDLSFIHPSERADFQKFMAELPIVDRRIILATGAIEGQQLWNTLNEVFFHTFHITDFNKLNIPFACVATDVETGEAVVMREGNLVSAVRASMAIPSVFTTVERDGFKLIDGGVVNNFPVSLAKEMGADFVIGVNVSQGLRPAEELQTPIDIIYQMGFYSDARNFSKNLADTDLYIEPDLEAFTAASFLHAEQIIEQGKRAARRHIDELAKLSDGSPFPIESRVPDKTRFSTVVDSIVLVGIEYVRPWYVRNVLGIQPGDSISAAALTRAVNRLYATGYFTRVHYNLQSCEQSSHVILILDIAERPFASLAGTLQYSSFVGTGISAKLSTNKFILYNMKASLAFLISEKPAYRAHINYFLNDRRNTWVSLASRGRYLTFPLYEDFTAITEYRQNYWHSEFSLNTITGENSYLSGSLAYYYQSIAPNMIAPVSIEGSNRSFIAGLNWHHHTLNRNAFPTRGQLVSIRNSFYFDQRPSFPVIDIDGETSTLDDLGIKIGNFFQIHISWSNFTPINDRLTQKTRLQLGYNIKYKQDFINSFNLGGTYAFLENQITFTGLEEYGLISENIAAASLGYQYHVWRSLYASANVNVAVYDFRFDMPEQVSTNNLVYGGGISAGYDALLGPLTFTLSYSPQAGRVIGYVNLGWMF